MNIMVKENWRKDMTDYICYGCNENCTYDEYALRDMDILCDIGSGDEIIDIMCPYFGEYTEFHKCSEGE